MRVRDAREEISMAMKRPARQINETICDGLDDLSDSSRAVARLLGVLEALSVDAEPLTNNVLATRLGVPPASMYRILKKMVALGYIECSRTQSSYGIGERLAALGERLADAGCRAPPLRRLMSEIRAASGATVTLWVRSGLHVRIAAVLVGQVSGSSSQSAGELASPFSTPGLAIASRYRREQLRALINQCRRKQIEFGRKYAKLLDVEQALRDVRARGFAAGYNLRADGWAMLAWPLDITASPLRVGALAIGAPVAILRREEPKIVAIVQQLLIDYVREQEKEVFSDLF
jgi:DNA-binding IclR family transcriptional regulator